MRFFDKAHHAFDAGAVVPAAIEDDDFTAGRKIRNVALHEHLRLLPVRRSRKRDNSVDAWAHPLGDRLDRPALAGRIAAFEDDDDPQTFRLNPLLDIAELGLELPQLLLVGFALHPAVLLLGLVLGLFLGFFHEHACCNAGPIMTLR